MFKKENKKMQKVIFTITIINICLFIISLMMVGIATIRGVGNGFSLAVTLGEFGWYGLSGALSWFGISGIIFIIIICLNTFATVYSLVESTIFRSKLSIVTAIMSIVLTIGLDKIFGLTMIPRLINRISHFL